MHGYTYILRCSDGTLYAGSAIYRDGRVAARQQGVGTTYTTNRRPLELIWWLSSIYGLGLRFAEADPRMESCEAPHLRGRWVRCHQGAEWPRVSPAKEGGGLGTMVSRETCGDRGHVAEVDLTCSRRRGALAGFIEASG